MSGNGHPLAQDSGLFDSLRRVRGWAERHAYELFVGMLVLVICELIVFSAVSKP